MRRLFFNHTLYNQILLLISLCLFTITANSDTHTKPTPTIISLAPSLTETVYALDAGPQLKGVTKYCRFPVAAKKLPNIGGYYDVNYELVFALQPETVLLLKEHENAKNRLKQLGINYIESDHQSLSGIKQSILTIGNALNKQTQAQQLIKTINNTLENIKRRAPQTYQPKVLISVGRSAEQGPIKSFFAAGNDMFYNELINLSGASNAYQGSLAYPTISIEGLISLQPDIILDLIPDNQENHTQSESVTRQWQAIFINDPTPPAIHVLSEDYMVIPGPRVHLTAQKIADIVREFQP